MKMVVFSNLFWGIIIILFGISVILKAMGVIPSIPLFRIFIAVILIFWGINLLFGFHKGSSGSFKGKAHVVSGVDNEYSVVFGSGTSDLSNQVFADGEHIEVTAVFGSNYVILPSDYHFRINPTAVFGSVKIPGRMSPKNGLPTVFVEANGIFGRVEFEQKLPRPMEDHKTGKAADMTMASDDY